MAPQKIRGVIQKFKSALRKAGFPPVRIFIFGSYARNQARADSDIDVCLVSEAFKRNKDKYRSKAVFEAFQVDPRLQVVLATPNDLKKNSLSALFSHISRESVAA